LQLYRGDILAIMSGPSPPSSPEETREEYLRWRKRWLESEVKRWQKLLEDEEESIRNLKDEIARLSRQGVDTPTTGNPHHDHVEGEEKNLALERQLKMAEWARDIYKVESEGLAGQLKGAIEDVEKMEKVEGSESVNKIED
jgi:predicted metal-dependent hydrolase